MVFRYLKRIWTRLNFLAAVITSLSVISCTAFAQQNTEQRERINLNTNWKFFRYNGTPDDLKYDERPEVKDRNDNKVADSKPTETNLAAVSNNVLKPWILPTANEFIADTGKHFKRPAGNPGSDFPFVQTNFNDAEWEQLDLPHDWAIKGPFYSGPNAEVGGGMGRLPVQGVAWYRKQINIPANDKGKNIYLDIDGAMSYAMVWLNGVLVGGWPYGYNSFRLNLTPHIKWGANNQVAIRIDNPNYSARWYPGAGLYRNVWLVKTNPVHVAHWGTFIQTKNISKQAATIQLNTTIDNDVSRQQEVVLQTNIYVLDKAGNKSKQPVAALTIPSINLPANSSRQIEQTIVINQPLLWGPLPSQTPNRYVAVNSLTVNGKKVDEYETTFGIREVLFDAEKGLFVNGEPIRIQGVNQHHDLGAIGAAFNVRAAERQLEILREMGCNAIRLAHNPPAPELLDLTDKMGFLVIDEIFDCWQRGKTPHDFHLIFDDWYEADVRSFIRRDRNHPSVIAWSYGNEVGEQYTEQAGAELSQKIKDIVHQEDNTRPATASMNYAKPDMPFSAVPDIISLNYQGEGIRDAPAYAHLRGIKTSPLYPAFHQQFPGKLIVSSETASALSTRGTYLFPVTNAISAPVSDSTGGDPVRQWVSAYELYTAAFGASADKVFASQDKHPYVAGEFVWSGWDYIGEPTPYYTARSSYSGIIDLAGFKKDRFYLYQSRWRPELPMAHILPHWNWPERLGKVTPVHVFTSGDEAELFLNGRSLGRKNKGDDEYRLRWDDVVYEPGELKVVAYKNGKVWANETIHTAGAASVLKATADHTQLNKNDDLSFITVEIFDARGNLVANADNVIECHIEGPGEIVATDNGDPADLESFASSKRKLFSGKALIIVRAKKNETGSFKVFIQSPGLHQTSVIITH